MYMSFQLIPHLPSLVAMVAKSFMCERKVSNLFYYFLLCFIINNQGKQHKMLRNGPVAIGWLLTGCVINFLMSNGKVSNFIYYYVFIFINNQGRQRKLLKKLNIHCYSYQVKKTILSYEYHIICACYDSDCQRKAMRV